jgi:predicted transcriptional regulator
MNRKKASLMKSANHRFSLSETPIIADHILRNYKRDRLYFEHYSPLFNNEFLIQFEENVNTLSHLRPLQALEKEAVKKTDQLQIIINHFHPLLNITEALLQKISDEPGFRTASLSLKQLREVLSKKCAWEIQKSCRNMVSELELLIEELIDKGFIIRILNDFHLLMQKLKDLQK